MVMMSKRIAANRTANVLMALGGELLGVQVEEAFRKHYVNPARDSVYIHADFLGQRYQGFALRGVHYEKRSARDVLAVDLHIAHAPNFCAASFVHCATNQVADVVASGRKFHAVGKRNLNLEADEFLGIVNGITGGEMEYCLAAAAGREPALAHRDAPWRASAIP
jgi:hypothetical protein